VAGPDGNLWFTEPWSGGPNDPSIGPWGDKIGMINATTHAVTEFNVPTQDANPTGITVGPDGNLWFTEEMGDKIGMINPTSHAISEFALPTPNALPARITAGPDGNLWFTETGAKQIGMINPATDAISEFSVPVATFAITAGPDGNLWFTDAGGVSTVNSDPGGGPLFLFFPDRGNVIGMFNPVTHAVTEFAVPTQEPQFGAITTGPDGNLWFTEWNGNKIGSINPTTHDIVETDLPTALSGPMGITTGPDGNLWFTEQGAGQIGTINPVTRSITDTDVSGFGVRGITTGPDGNLWFTEAWADEIGVLAPPPTLPLLVTAEPPSFVAANTPFGLTVTVKYPTGLPDTGFEGDITLALLNPDGATLGGTLTVAAHDGVASFSGLTINQAGSGYRIAASTDSLTTTLTTPVTVAVFPTTVAEKAIVAGKGQQRHIVAFELNFSGAVDPTRAASVASYTVMQFRSHRRQLVAQAVHFRATYDAAAHRVTLTLSGRPKFAQGGRLEVRARPPGAITDAASTLGEGWTFAITPRGSVVAR